MTIYERSKTFTLPWTLGKRMSTKLLGLPRLAFVAAVVFLAFALVASGEERTKYNFNPDWRVKVGDVSGAEAPGFDDKSWKTVSTPYAWNEDDAFRKSIHDMPVGIAWYRKHFVLPAGSAGKKVFLEFEGIRHAGEFYLNGKLIGSHENGVMAFGFDITSIVKPAPAENVLAARIDNSWTYREKASNSTFQWADRNFYANYGGINKSVYLHVTGQLYQTLPLYSNLGTTGVYVYAQEFDIPRGSARITAESQIKNESSAPKTFTYEVRLEDMNGKTVATLPGGSYTLAAGKMKTVAASDKVADLHFWSWGYGYLYTVRTVLKVDGAVVDEVATRTGFRKTAFEHGMVKLNDRVIHLKGYAQRTTNEWPAVGLSVPAWMSDFSNRLIVEGNGNLVRWMHVTPWKQDVESCDRVGLIEAMPAGDSEKDATGRHWEMRLEVMRDAIIYNRNNPSILFYESGNKGVSDEHMQQMKAIRDQYDPHGGRASGSREMLDSKVAEYGGEMLYINKSLTKPLWAMEFSRDEGLRKYVDDFTPPFHKDSPDYNRNQDSRAIENVRRWYDYWRERPGTGDRVNAGGVNIIFSDSNTHFRGEENYRRSGEVDGMRIPKDGYFANQVMWDGWVDVERPRLHIIGHWNYAPGVEKNVYVVSSAEKVELFINGQSKGFGEQSYRFLYTFANIKWQPGTVKAVGYDAQGQKISGADLKTVGAPASIHLKTRTGPQGLLANGSDLALVDVEVVDAEGNRCPTALNMIHFDLKEPAEWRGGIAQGPENYILSTDLPVEGSVNRVILRAGPQEGKIVLAATAEALQPASIMLASIPTTVTGGLSQEDRASGLQSYLVRGPTPVGASFAVSSSTVHIAAATAGANADRVMQSFDDNETSHWENDGKLDTAWIEYVFDHPATPDELVVKLMSWRNRSYPIRITVDSQEVFAGATPVSLGYVHLPLKPVTGERLRIQLTAPAQGQGGINLTELTNTRDSAATGVGVTDNGTLSIVEVEIHQGQRH